ncbi:MAG: BspA family leucine-rich repeat surface protein [Firmicutes bacterium]|nr:BspA family leucine-rich repeat surface protein [Bacillota bacterium]
MKKLFKNISMVLFSCLLVLSIFKTLNAVAEEVIFKITKIEVNEKSDGVIVNDVSVSNNKIKNDIIFSDIDEQITYNITINNNSNNDYIIKSISCDNNIDYLEYTYDDLSDVKIKSGEDKIFNLTIKYTSMSPGVNITNKPINLTLTYERTNGTTGTKKISTNGSEETITNPKTGDNVVKYIILGIISLTGLVVTTVSKKHLSKSLMLIGLFSIISIPFGVKAVGDKFIITLATNNIANTSSKLINGSDFSVKANMLASGLNLEYRDITGDTYTKWLFNTDTNLRYTDSTIKHIKRATNAEYEIIKDTLTADNLISIAGENFKSYMWFSDSTIYLYTDAKFIKLNEDSSWMFSAHIALEDIDLGLHDTSDVTNMDYMFTGNSRVTKIDVSNWNTSKVTSMKRLFSEDSLLSTLDVSKWNTSNVTNMSATFAYLTSITKIDVSNWDTSKVTDISLMFFNDSKLASIDVSKWDTSNVTNMQSLFYYCKLLEEIDTTNWDTSNVTNMSNMFSQCSSLKEVKISNWDASKVTSITEMFARINVTSIDTSIFHGSPLDNDISNTFRDLQRVEELDLSFLHGNVNVNYAFYGSTSLKRIYVSDDFVANRGNSVFYNIPNIVGGKGSNRSVLPNTSLDLSYARIDDPDNGKPGLLTNIADKQQ